ncbi:YbaB/EbfC family nucleoid-associated protein [Candidatus Parcubacteria bacterium]|nr:YbaB/EbfC family nucleoid-associated protein [Candidatus Parcubacteria bacterium]
MFSKLKHIKELRSQGKSIQNALAQESTTTEKNNIKVVMNGNMEIISLDINDPGQTNLSANLTSAINEAIKKTQKLMAEKMQAMGGLGNLGL